MQRRAFLRAAGATALLAIARRARADMAAPMPPPIRVLSGVSAGAAPMPQTILDVRTDGSHDFVKLGADLGAHAPHVFSIDNANARFVVWAMTMPVPDGSWPYLVDDRDGTLRMGTSIGTGDGDGSITTATFEVDAATALRLARDSGITAEIRLPLDTGLTYAWSNPGGAARGKPVRIALRVSNGGTSTVRFAIGGRNDGPRDNRFSFRVRRDGREVATIDATDFGGKTFGQRLAPGDHVDVETDLRKWIDAPGAYDVDCEYAGELFPDNDDFARWPEHAAETWEVAPRGSLRVIIP